MTSRKSILLLYRHPIVRSSYFMTRSTAASRSSYYSTESNNSNNDTNNKNNLDGKDFNDKNNGASNKALTYQDTLSSVQAVSRSQLEKLQRDLQPFVHKVQNASSTLKRLTQDVTDSKEALRRASMAINELTGYNKIELVKKKVTDQAVTFERTRDQVQIAKTRYELAIATRSSTQRGINELLQRKHLWTGEDVTQFTELYRLEHEHAKEEETAKEHYQQMEKQMDREYLALARSIMERYHDEQLWSDKIRSVSTYGTWALMVVNLMLFVAVQTVFEPRKRKRLTDRFEELLVDTVADQEEKFSKAADAMAQTDQMLMERQQMLVNLLTQLKDEHLLPAMTATEIAPSTAVEMNESATMGSSATQMTADIGVPPVVVTETVDQDSEKASTPVDLSSDSGREGSIHTLITCSQHDTDSGASLSSPSTSSSSTIVLSQRSLILYSLESALAGGLITALAVFFWK